MIDQWFTCRHCAFETSSLQTMQQHQAEAHPINPEGAPAFPHVEQALSPAQSREGYPAFRLVMGVILCGLSGGLAWHGHLLLAAINFLGGLGWLVSLHPACYSNKAS